MQLRALIKSSATPNDAINAISRLSETLPHFGANGSPLIHPFSHTFVHVCSFLLSKGQVQTYYVPHRAEAWGYGDE